MKEEIGRRVRDARDKKGISQEKLAELVDLSLSSISRLETGRTMDRRASCRFYPGREAGRTAHEPGQRPSCALFQRRTGILGGQSPDVY